MVGSATGKGMDSVGSAVTGTGCSAVAGSGPSASRSSGADGQSRGRQGAGVAGGGASLTPPDGTRRFSPSHGQGHSGTLVSTSAPSNTDAGTQ
jgi:hypothetical protein